MLIHLNLQKTIARQSYLLICIGIVLFLLKIIIGEFIAGTLSDRRVSVNKILLTKSILYLPQSAQLLARLAEYESSQDNDNQNAELHLEQAIKLSPNNFKYRLLLAQIRDAANDKVGAENAYNEAVTLAPNYSDVHWRFANFLVRQKRVEESIEHFRLAANANPALFPSTLDLIWVVSDRNITYLKRIVENNQKGQLKLVLMLANQSFFPAAAEIFSKVDKETAINSWETISFFDLLINKGFSKLANTLWDQLKAGNDTVPNNQIVWNGGFETKIESGPAQFDWKLRKSDYARISIDNSQANSGSSSLLIDFLGRDTTKLDNEVRHIISLRPGTTYRLDYYLKTEELKTNEGPRVVISNKTGNRVAQTEPVPFGTNDWKRFSLIFTAPSKTIGDAATLFISIKRQPQYSYDPPLQGRIWFDDFSVSEVKGK